MGTGNITDIEDLAASHRKGERLLGLDLGTKTIGIAVSDGLLSIATPLTTIRRKKFGEDAARLLTLAEANNVAGLVLGLPLNMDGSEGPRAQASRAFARNLAGHSDLPVALWDERLSTVAAEREMLAMDYSRRQRAEKIDAAAAAIILQGALERIARLRD